MNFETASVYEVRAKKTVAGPGLYGYDAEARVEDSAGERVFVHATVFSDVEEYTVAEKSAYEFMTGDGEPVEDFLEEYGSEKEAGKSAYRKVFEMLADVIGGMKRGVK